jgi:hypothetical protein
MGIIFLFTDFILQFCLIHTCNSFKGKVDPETPFAGFPEPSDSLISQESIVFSSTPSQVYSPCFISATSENLPL